MANLSKYVGPPQGTPYALSTLSAKIDIPDLVKDLDVANKQIATSVSGKLKLIQAQMDHLQREAVRIVERAKQDMELHSIPCSVQKRVGVPYFLYEKETGYRFFSILSPEDWGSMIPGKFQSCWKLEPDMSWSEIF